MYTGGRLSFLKTVIFWQGCREDCGGKSTRKDEDGKADATQNQLKTTATTREPDKDQGGKRCWYEKEPSLTWDGGTEQSHTGRVDKGHST